jgi:hypothetical protein
MTTFATFFDGFVAKKGDSNCHSLFRWFCSEEGEDNNVVNFFYGGGVMKKQLAIILFYFFLLWSFWSNSLKLIINIEMVGFFNFEGYNG